ncbi:MAG: CDP-alcohol phosphatidyltransferase family protein [Nanoarchaeota archaeon]|nr:CDP-alcohol phosphatidyltransferase family protein [Nanoarchaeota archaeon]
MTTPSIEEIRRKNPIKTFCDPFVYIPTYVGLYVVRLLYPTKITPNQVSFVSYLLYVVASLFIAINHYFILALVFLQIVIVLDGVDGRLARTKNQTSLKGKFYEHITHETCPPLLFFALGSYLYLSLNNVIYLYLGSFIVISRLIINSFGAAKEMIALRSNKEAKDSRILEHKNRIVHIIILQIITISNIPFAIWMVTLGYIFNYLGYVLMFYTIYFSGVMLLKVYRELISS